MVASLVARHPWPEDEAPTRPRGGCAPEPLVLEFEVTTSSESQFFAGLSGDVSEGGIFIPTYQRVTIGTRATMSLSLPNGDFDVHGVVQWTRDASQGTPPGVGIAFEALPVEARVGVEAFCRLRAPLYYDPD
jgi:uncharacterized protein (TIGR02266 family)